MNISDFRPARGALPGIIETTTRSATRRHEALLGLGMALALILGPIGCSEEPPSSATDDLETASDSLADPRPSIVLIVVESLRTDAVRGYGRDRTSQLSAHLNEDSPTATPELDALIARSYRFDWALAASPETATSHASLFTGLRADEHGVGLQGRTGLPEDAETLAESLAAEGYETVGFSEHPVVGPDFGLDQGFEHFETPEAEAATALIAEGGSVAEAFGLLGRIRRWADERSSDRPFFLYVNLSDAHLPFRTEADGRFMPNGLTGGSIASVLAKRRGLNDICRQLPEDRALGVMRGAYLQAVAEADRKVGVLAGLFAPATAGGTARTILIVTADHGTHLGEQGLLGHELSVDNRTIHVPLVVTGAPGLEAGGHLERPVAQRRLADSIRCWTGSKAACHEGLSGNREPAGAPIISVAPNESTRRPPAAVYDTGNLSGKSRYSRAYCDSAKGFDGHIMSYLDPPMKYVWRQYGPDSLFDLSWDPGERADQIERRPELAREMGERVERFVARVRLDRFDRASDQRKPLLERVRDAYQAGRATMLAEPSGTTDTVWFAQQFVGDRADPEVEAWIEAQTPRHSEDLYYPIIDGSSLSPIESKPVLPHGVARFAAYLHAAVAGPDAIALPHLEEYLAMEDTTGYILTHQLSGLEWARALGRPLPPSTYARSADFVEHIRAELRSDDRFRDLWAERAAFITLFGSPTPEELEAWSRKIVEHHLGHGDWGHGGTEIDFDGQRLVSEQPRQHLRGMVLIVLSRYLAERHGE